MSDITTMQNKNYHQSLLNASILLTLSALFLAGCATNAQEYPVTANRKVATTDYQRIEIPPEALGQGLRELFRQFSEHHGYVNSEPIIKDYTPIIRDALYRTGYCSVQKLNLNDVSVDIDVYFHTEQALPELTIDAFLQGAATPAYRVSNHYYVTAMP
jgi:hypothetical protein